MAKDLILGRRRPSRAPLVLAIGVGIGLCAGFLALATFRTGELGELQVDTAAPALGRATGLKVVIPASSRGVERVQVRVRQGETEHAVLDDSEPTVPAWQFWHGPVPGRTLELDVGSKTVPGLKEGQATVEVELQPASTWLLRPEPATWSQELPVYLNPPPLSETSKDVFPAQGGVEAVVYSVGPTAHRHGVQVDERVFPGFPLGDTGQMFAFFAIPYDRDTDAGVVLFAEDVVNNRVELPFIDRFERRPMTKDRIRLTESLMQQLVPRIMARVPELEDQGDLLKNYIQINDDLRRRLDERLVEIGSDTKKAFLWSRPFVQMPAKVVSSFADRRTYLYQGQQVDQQDHLGFDLASVQQDEVPAANDGVVVMADYFGIYGNCIIVDHGYGLMSLYAHLSSFDVKSGERVERGQILGRTGATGLALGDHLHFSMLLQGLAVNPLEWWDPQWIENRIATKLRPALVYAAE